MTTIRHTEANWVTQQLKIYNIKYAEIYNEVYDHMVSAIEAKRSLGDTRDILVLFQETIDADLGGYQGIDRMAEQRPRQIISFLTKSLNKEFLSHFYTSKIIWLLASLLLLVSIATVWNWEAKSLAIIVFCMSLIPTIFFILYGIINRYFRAIRSKRKKSLVNNCMLHISTTTSLMIQVFVQLIPSLASFFVDKEWIEIGRDMIAYMGVWGMSSLGAVIVVYSKSIIKIIQKDYTKMIDEITPAMRQTTY